MIPIRLGHSPAPRRSWRQSSVTWFATVAMSICLGTSLRATDYYVNGAIGSNTANGLSPTAAWATLTHAFTVLASVGPGHVLHIAGNQTYGTSEVFPLTPPSGLTILGSSFSPPILGVPMGQTGFMLASNGPRTDNIRFLRIAGGTIGIDAVAIGLMGPALHSIAIEDCEFVAQTSQAIRVRDIATARVWPQLVARRCTFLGMPFAIYADVLAYASFFLIEVEDCRFEGISQTAFHSNAFWRDTDNHPRIRRSIFVDCLRGIEISGGFSHTSQLTSVLDSRFVRCAVSAVRIVAPPDSQNGIEISRNAFEACGRGVDLQVTGQPPVGGYHAIQILDNHFQACGTGLAANWLAAGPDQLNLVGNWYELCGRGCELALAFGVNVNSLRERYHRNTNGVALFGTLSSFTMQSSMVTESSGGGMLFGASPAPSALLRITSLTIADNSQFGITLGSMAPVAQVSHCVFDNAVAGLHNYSGANVTYCCFNNQTIPGIGNLTAAPQLVRPEFKLAPGSPCINAGSSGVSLAPTDYEGDPRSSGAGPDLGADEYVGAGSVRIYGLGGLGFPSFLPTIGTTNADARIGTWVTATLSNAPGATGAALFLGSGETPISLPRSLEAFGARGSYLWMEPYLLINFTTVLTGGGAVAGLQIPLQTSLIGSISTLQWIVFKPSVNAAQFVTTQGLRVTIGT